MVCGNMPTFGWVYGRLVGWVGQWVGSCQISKSQINCDLIEIIQFCLKIYDLWNTPPMGGCMGECVGYCVGQGVGSCRITKN